jgi:hypothetical protein
MGTVGELTAGEQQKGRIWGKRGEGDSWEEGRGGEEAASRGQGTCKNGIHHTRHGEK